MQCNIHADMIRSEVSNMCQETGRRLQDVIDKMQDTRDEETGQVQTMMRALDMKVNECHQKLVELLNDDSSKPIHPADLEVFQKELEAERVCRRDLIKDVYARINEEMIRVTKVMDEHRAAALEAVAQERWARSEDAAELRATFGAMRSQACNVEKKDVQAVNMRGEEHPEDPEDLYTLYEMVREALGDTVHLRQLLAEEKSERIHEFSSNRQQMDMLSRELNTMQALLREAAAGRTEAQ
ncbi:unnamed protein product [Durusdinium trenchii]|uniref:Uncharacterized protein n=2 Tax=Durusdinium trenchii TaxID=1381693 RepID=A0ABP0KGN5_9DINO